jgi:cystathionine beta-lyase/cystathionine gamma-synthase
VRLSGVRRGRYGSPGLLRALELGADVSVVALSKYWGGHSDLLAGAAVANAKWCAEWRGGDSRKCDG